jgi:predicted PurR-regulated permease PerM
MTAAHRTSLLTFLSLLLLSLTIVHKMVYVYLLSIFMGGLLALLSYPLYRGLTRRRLGPKWASTVVTLLIIVVVLAPVAGFTVAAIGQAAALGEKLSSSEGLSLGRLMSRFQPPEAARSLGVNRENIEKQVRAQVQNAGRYASGFVLRLARNVPDFILQLALASLACFFFLADGPKFLAWLMPKVPLDPDVRRELVDSFKSTAISSMWAGLAAASVQSALMMGAFAALRVPGALLAGGVTFILSWTPIIGSTPTWIVGAVYLYSTDSPGRAALMLAAGGLTGVMDNVMRAWVLKGRDDMHPLVSLVAILGGIHMFGLMGVFVGPVLAAMFIALMNTWPEVGRRAGLRLDGAGL